MTQEAVQNARGAVPAATEILFVDAGVPESEILLAGLAPQVEVVRLAGDRGGLEQITWTLAGRTGIAALHILGHGRAGQIDLGDGVLTLGTLAAGSVDVSAWRRSLAESADILVYGCGVAGSADGTALIAQLAALTGADVAASTDATGAAALGGNWTLEAQTGPIKAALPFSAAAMAGWQHTLNHFRYGTMSWEPVPGSPNTVLIKGQVDWTNDHGWIPPGTPIGGIVPNRLVLNFGDGTTQNVAVRVLSRDPVTDDVLTEFVSDLNGDGTIGPDEVGIRHVYASSGSYEVFWNSSARETAINLVNTTWQQDMRIDLGQAGNRSPVVATPAVVQVVDDTTFTYQIAASDPDGNPLRFRYGTQDEFYNNGVTTEATRPTGLTLTPGGLITWDVHDGVLATAAGDRWQVTIVAEDLDASGNVRSFVPVDFVLNLVPAGSQPPVFTQLPSGPQSTPSGQTSTFTVEMDDPDSAAAPTITVLNPPSTDPAVFSTTTGVDGSGKTTLTISFRPTAAQQGNSYVVNIRGRDGAGLTSDQNITLTVPDTTPPAVPFALALTTATDSGVSSTDAVTNVAASAVTGRADAGSTVTVLVDGAAVGATTADSSGTWSFALGAALPDGAHNVTATAADTAGNVSAASAALTVTIDTVAPAAPAGLVLVAASDSGALGDDLTNMARPTIAGTAGAGDLIALYAGSTLIGAGMAASDGAWSITATAPLSEGLNALTARASDAAGNASAASVALNVTLDTIAPAAASIGLASASDSGVVGDGITNVSTPELTGTAEANSTVTLTDGVFLLGTAQADGAGLWSLTLPVFAEGAHSVTARATDAAGNASFPSGALALAIDTTAPAVTEALSQDTGLNYDRITSDPTLTGSADPGDMVTLSEGAAVLGTAVADSSGAWRFTPAGLAQGPHTIVASNTDAAGNTGQATLSFVFDAAAPTTDYTLVDGSGARSEGVLAPVGQFVPGVARGFAYGGADGVTILARADNAQLKGGAGGDAIVAQGGRSVLDGNGGSDWLVGGAGQNSFVVDARGGTWNTVLGFKAGDDIAVRGIQDGASTFRWVGTDGASGYQGATLRGGIEGADQAFSVTFAGLTVEQAKRYAAVIEREADGTPVLRLRAPSPAAPDDASYAITDLTTGAVTDLRFDPYGGTAPGLRYQHIEAGDTPAVLLAKASDSLLKSGAGNDALAVRNGDNVLDAGGGSNWLVGGAGNDKFLVTAGGGQPVWNTVVNFHAGDELVMRGYQEGVSSWSWTATKEGATGYEGATLRGALNGRDSDFSLTFAGISVEEARGFVVSPAAADGVGALSIRA